jgi:hypothetical protein
MGADVDEAAPPPAWVVRVTVQPPNAIVEMTLTKTYSCSWSTWGHGSRLEFPISRFRVIVTVHGETGDHGYRGSVNCIWRVLMRDAGAFFLWTRGGTQSFADRLERHVERRDREDADE